MPLRWIQWLTYWIVAYTFVVAPTANWILGGCATPLPSEDVQQWPILLSAASIVAMSVFANETPAASNTVKSA